MAPTFVRKQQRYVMKKAVGVKSRGAMYEVSFSRTGRVRM